MMMPAGLKGMDSGGLSMPDASAVSKAWEGGLSIDELNAASIQDVFNMAFAVDEWSNLSSLWPGMDQFPIRAEQYALG
jgi:hypothetical protein